MLRKFKNFLIDYCIVVFLVICINVIIRLGEFWYINNVKLEEIPFRILYSRSINYDTLFIILFSLIGLFPFSFLSLFNLKITRFFVRLLFLLLITILLLLTGYFLINNALLSSAVFEFSITEITTIIFSELSTNRITLLSFGCLLILTSIILLYKSIKWKQIINPQLVIGLYIFISIISLINYKHTFKSINFFKNYNQFLVGNSKPIFLIKTYNENLKLEAFKSDEEIKKEILKFKKLYKNKNFTSKTYPLINDFDYHNVLENYFTIDTLKPNIVIIISESLSASFSGKNSMTKNSLTPFVDSIASKGLSWINFFSNAERSYGVLPNLLSSLPSGIGSRGFINMKQDTLNKQRFPKHNSLIKILNSNDYYTSYFYGGSGLFDNVALYLHQNNVDNCFTMEKFDTLKYPMNLYLRSKQAWGHRDGDVYNQGLDAMDTIKKPYFSIFQTLSNHSPYNLSEEMYYSNNYILSKLKTLNLTTDDVQKIDKNILSSIFYADDALKHFFERIKKRDDYKNTIFIITGDHAVDLNLTNNVFENYHVPFVIYSPLLTKTAEFKGVCSHIDVLPSLLELLKNNFNLNIPKNNHWLGKGLNTNINFESTNIIPLNIRAIDMPGFIVKDRVLFGNNVYKFDEQLKIQKIKDSTEIDEFKQNFKTYVKINNYVCKNNLIDM